MSKKKTVMAMVVDRSGSMTNTARQAEQNYNETVAQMRSYSKEQDIYCCLVTFSDEVFENLWLARAEEVQDMKTGDFVCDGWTAFRDGLGHTIKRLKEMEKESLAAGEDIAFLISIISDGGENASKYIGEQELHNLVSECEATKRWTFLYMGCSASNLREVQQMTGIPISNMAVWSNQTQEDASFGYSSHRSSYSNYMDSRSKGVIQTECLYSNDSHSFADFTNGESADNVAVGPSLDHLVSTKMSDALNNYKNISSDDLAKFYK